MDLEKPEFHPAEPETPTYTGETDQETPESIKRLLDDIRDLLRNSNHKELLQNERELLGFQIGWLRPTPEVLEIIRSTNPELTYDDCEIVLINNHSQGDCHLHEVGKSNFIVLGELDGFEKPDGGIFVADYQEGETEYDLIEKRLHEGDYLHIPPKQIHAFFVNSGTMTVLGMVNPKIKQGEDEFDAVDFDYTDPKKTHVTLHQ